MENESVKKLIERAAVAPALDAMHLAQAALNAANALVVLKQVK